MEGLKSYFRVGKIRFEAKRNVANYRVENVQDLYEIVVPHYPRLREDKYPLITQKKADFLLFKEAVKKVYHKEHLTQKGLELMVSLKPSSNLGLSPKLKIQFPHIIPFPRPEIKNQKIYDIN